MRLRTLLVAGTMLLAVAAPAGAGTVTRAAGLGDDDPSTWGCAGVDLLAAMCLDNPLDWLPDPASALEALPGR